MNHYSEFTYPTDSLHGTIRGISRLPTEIQVVSVPPQIQVPKRQHGYKRVDGAISNFHIEFDNGEKYQPGTDITGRVVMDVWSAIDIRYIEFVIQGKATVRQFKERSSFSQRPKNEVHLHKKILLLSPKDGQASLILTPGKYVSSFLYKLPSSIPPTVDQTDLSNGYVFSISYTAQANICDFLHKKNSTDREKYAQVIKSIKRPFTVVPEFDYQSLPGALDPITHAEQFNLTMSWLNADPTSILVKLNHQVYAVGDVLGLHLEIYTAETDRIGRISADFEQRIIVKGESTKRFKRIIIRALDNPRERKYRLRGQSSDVGKKIKNMYKTGFKIPIPKSMIPSLLPHSKLIDVSYVIQVVVKFKKLGGTLHIQMPVTIAPTMDPEILSTQKSTIPLFNKPIMQFPYFAKNPLRDSSRSMQSTSPSTASDESFRKFMNRKNGGKKQKKKHEKVRVSHKNCFGF